MGQSASSAQLDLQLAAAPANTVLGRNGRVIDLGKYNVAQYVAQRVGAARTGNTVAAYEVYQAISICARNDDPVTEFQDARDHEQFRREQERTAQLCTGVSPAMIQERMHFLAAVASAGNAAAQIDFYMEGPQGKPLAPSAEADDPVVQKWKTDALSYLKDAGNKGEPFALGLLATLYDGGDVVERDARLSLAYTIAEGAARKHPPSLDQLRARYGEQLNPAQFDEAQQLGQRLARSCCDAAPLLR